MNGQKTKRLLSVVVLVCIAAGIIFAHRGCFGYRAQTDTPGSGAEGLPDMQGCSRPTAASGVGINLNTDDIEKACKAEITDKIINREIVVDSLLCFIDDETLLADIKEYNDKTGEFYSLFSRRAAQVVCALYDAAHAAGEPAGDIQLSRLMDMPQYYRGLYQKIAKYCMYRDPHQLMKNDDELAAIINVESGSGIGIWPYHMQTDADYWETSDWSVSKELTAYFELTDKIINDLRKQIK